MSMLQPIGGFRPAPKPDKALPKVGRTKMPKGIPAKVRAEVKARDGWSCILCGAQTGLTLHHRKLRSAGGDHSPTNLLTLCQSCHVDRVHGHPQWALDRGLIVASWADPAEVPVSPSLRGEQ